jgi:hypothetical protein
MEYKAKPLLQLLKECEEKAIALKKLVSNLEWEEERLIYQIEN